MGDYCSAVLSLAACQKGLGVRFTTASQLVHEDNLSCTGRARFLARMPFAVRDITPKATIIRLDTPRQLLKQTAALHHV